ncbi:MAG: DUF4907 domain-containing protein [Bacteroidota bacterium]
MKKQLSYITVLCFTVLVAYTLVFITDQNILIQHSDQNLYSMRVQKNHDNESWTYFILYEEKVLIKQDRIPAVQGHQYFGSRHDAMKVAELVLKKFKNRESPVLSIKELVDLGISFTP